jgi:hypothetical protein
MDTITAIYLNHAALQPRWRSTVIVRQVVGPPHQEVFMRLNSFILAAAVGIAASGTALAGDLRPVQSQGIDLGRVAGDAYYTVEPDGFHVVATFAERGEASAPVRFQTVLSPGQAVIFSTPRGVGEQPVSFTIKRQADRVIVAKTSWTN